MNREELGILARDLFARIPFGVMCRESNAEPAVYGRVYDYSIYSATITYGDTDHTKHLSVNEWLAGGGRICLRPIADMTSDELLFLTENYISEGRYAILDGGDLFDIGNMELCDLARIIDFFDSRHIDYRNLIGRGLAIPAPEGMYELPPLWCVCECPNRLGGMSVEPLEGFYATHGKVYAEGTKTECEKWIEEHTETNKNE